MAKISDSSRGQDMRVLTCDVSGGESSKVTSTAPTREAKEEPMEKLAQNIQEAFLNNARKEKTFLTIYLMSGVKLSGRIKSFDKYSVVLETNNQEQLIFKHAISTVVVSKPFHASAGAHPWGATNAPVPAAPAETHEE